MEIHFTGRNIEVTPALKRYTEEKMERLEHRAHLNKVNVTFHVENVTHIAEANTHLNGFDIHASAQADDMYAAIDMLVDKLQGQIVRHKEKSTDHHHR